MKLDTFFYYAKYNRKKRGKILKIFFTFQRKGNVDFIQYLCGLSHGTCSEVFSVFLPGTEIIFFLEFFFDNPAKNFKNYSCIFSPGKASSCIYPSSASEPNTNFYFDLPRFSV